MVFHVPPAVSANKLTSIYNVYSPLIKIQLECATYQVSLTLAQHTPTASAEVHTQKTQLIHYKSSESTKPKAIVILKMEFNN